MDLKVDPDKQWPDEQQREREMLARSQRERDRARMEMDRLRRVIEGLSSALEKATIEMLARRGAQPKEDTGDRPGGGEEKRRKR